MLELAPNSVDAHSNLGIAHLELGEIDQAVACFHRALVISPESVEVLSNLAVALKRQGRFDEAIAIYHRAIQLRPSFVQGYCNLGAALNSLGRLDEAADCFENAIELAPDHVVSLCNLGVAKKDLGQFDEAETALRRALEIEHGNALVQRNLGSLLLLEGNIPEALDRFRQALEFDPSDVIPCGNLLFSQQYQPGITLAGLDQSRAKFGDLLIPIANHQKCKFTNSLELNRVIKVGFVSADLANHPIGYLLEPLLKYLDRSCCQVYCYSNRAQNDHVTEKLRTFADSWRSVEGLSDDQMTTQIVADEIDVLIDLSGHTANNRLAVFARRPAPIQASWLSGTGPTGLSTIEYFISDRVSVSDELLRHYRERVIRLPTIWCCTPPEAAPEVGPLPANKNDYVTFASFNNLAKINHQVVQTWAAILNELPSSRLIMKYLGLDSPSATKRYRELFAAAGVDPDRVEMQGFSPSAEMLELYNSRVDIALDPFPFNGGMTTMLALYMGVPVVTMPGETVASRQSVAILTALGMIETVAHDRAEYVERAVEVASNLPRLAEWRRQLRPRYLASPLYDGPGFARNWSQHLKQVWRQWVEQNPE